MKKDHNDTYYDIKFQITIYEVVFVSCLYAVMIFCGTYRHIVLLF